MPKYSTEKKNTNPVFVQGSYYSLLAEAKGFVRPCLAAVSVVKRNATSFRIPEAVANDGKGQRSIRKRLDCLCQTFSCATPCRAVFGGSEGIRTLVPLRAVTAFRVRAVMTTSIRFHIMYVNIKFVAEAYRSGRRSLRSAEDHLPASLSLLLLLRKRIEVVGVRFARLRTTCLLLFPYFFCCGSVSKWSAFASLG